MSLQEWNYIQVYLYRKYKIDPHNFKLIFNIASCIGHYKDEDFSIEIIDDIDLIIKKLIQFLEKGDK